MTTPQEAQKLLDLAEFWEKQCNRYVNGQCQTRRCIVRGGWSAGPVNYDFATCEEHETALVLRAASTKEGLSDVP
jgi:hypothetical protein